VRDDRLYLLHTLDEIDQALLNASEGKSQYLSDRKTEEATIRNLEVLGEAAKNVSARLKKSHPEVPWKQAAGFRDKLIHHYFGMNHSRVWEALTRDMPELKVQIEAILRGFPQQTL